MERLLRVVFHLCRLLLGGIFLYAGLSKTQDVSRFAGNIAAYQILPYLWNYLLAATLPYVEVMAGLLLVINRRVRPAAMLLALLTLGFMAVLGSVLYRGLEIDCGCFGSTPTTPQVALWRDLGLLLLAHCTFHLRNRFTPGTEH
jgi:putative oxidoreductase